MSSKGSMGKRSVSSAGSAGVPTPEPDSISSAHVHILAWYLANRRDLPWRATRDPYAILVSEIMLQQTQVDRVLPKYRQFLALFPTLADLAAAPTSEVISAWIPLGYNTRAVRLQSIARQVIAEYGGCIPTAVEDLLRLKGIGRYTAGAIACFAYHQRVATVDTNIYRVLHRVFLGLEYPEARLTTEQMFLFAEQVLPGDAFDWNQALMDLGATICSSANPQCSRCPVQELCAAHKEMSQYSLFPGGAALRQMRKVAEKKAPYKVQPFTSTNRYFRGRVVDHLRSLSAQQRIALDELGSVIKPNYCRDDLPWLQELVQGLARDGLVDSNEAGVRLP